MSAYLKYFLVTVVCLVVFGAGYQYAAALYEADIAKLKEEHARASKELSEEYRLYEYETNERFAQAWDDMETYRNKSISLTDDVLRVRNETDRLKRRLSQAGDSPCTLEREQILRGAILLERCSGLLERGSGLSQECAIRHDALTKIIK